MQTIRGSYAALMSDLSPFFVVLLISGFFLMCALAAIAIVLLRTWYAFGYQTTEANEVL